MLLHDCMILILCSLVLWFSALYLYDVQSAVFSMSWKLSLIVFSNQIGMWNQTCLYRASVTTSLHCTAGVASPPGPPCTPSRTTRERGPARQCEALPGRAGGDWPGPARPDRRCGPGAVVGPSGEGGETTVAETAGQADQGQVPSP